MVPLRLRPLVAVLVLLLGAAGPVAPAQAQSTTVFRGGQLFDTSERAVRPNPGLVVRAGKIVARGATDLDTTGARIVRLDSTQVLLPGFIDLHAHYAVDFFGEGRVEETEGYPLLYLANGARALGMSDRLGTLEVGAWADLLVVRGNPLSDIRNTRNVEWVMTRGDLRRAEALRDAARGTVGPAGAAEAAAFKPDRTR